MKIRILLILTLLLILLKPDLANSSGLKLTRKYPVGHMSDVMPWSMDASEGWLYIGSDEGLLQYGGAEPDLFPMNNHRPVRSVKIDKEKGVVFAGGLNEFGYFVPSPDSSLEYVCLTDSIGEDRHIGNVWGIHPVGNEVIVQGDNCFLKYNLTNGQYKIINSPYKLDVSALINEVLWVGTDDGLKILLGNDLADVPDSEALKNKKIRGILPFEDSILIVTSDAVWKYSNRHLIPLPQFNKAISELKEIFSAGIQGDTLALGSVSHGLAIIDTSTGGYDIYDENSELPSNTVISLHFDSKGNLWTGLQYGISKILLGDPVSIIDNSIFPIGSGYTMAQYGDKVFMGTNRGLYVSDYDTETHKIGKEISRVPELRSQVWGLSLHDNKVFVSLDEGLYVIDNPRASPERISTLKGVWDVRAMLQNPDKMYAGTYSGLHLLKKQNGKWSYHTPIEGYLSSMFNFAQESPVVIWNNNADEGMDRIVIDTVNNKVKEIKTFTSTQDGTPLEAETNISRIDNRIYFTTEQGLYTYDPKTESIIKEKTLSGLLEHPGVIKRVKKINGSLMALTPSGLVEADPAGILNSRRVPLSPSASRPTSFSDVFFPIGNDAVGYPVRSGFLIVDLASYPENYEKADSSAVFIRKITLPTLGDSVVYAGNLKNLKKEFSLEYPHNSLKIEYGSIEDIENGVTYSTRLKNERWSTPSKSLSRELSELAPGKHTFEIKSISLDGSEKIDSITFRVQPPWWRSNMMLLVYFLVGMSLLLILAGLILMKVSRREKRLIEEKDREISLQRLQHKKETEDKDRQIHELEREQLDRDLKHKAQEMANAMISLTNKNEALQTVKKELQKIMTLVPQGNIEARKAISELQQQVVVDLRKDDVLKRVEEEFDIVHDNFMKKLRQRFTDLNNNEVLLCAYIRMNLSTKEIAPLMNISPRGVETIRYRLRKKLGLEREESLSGFINNFN